MRAEDLHNLGHGVFAIVGSVACRRGERVHGVDHLRERAGEVFEVRVELGREDIAKGEDRSVQAKHPCWEITDFLSRSVSAGPVSSARRLPP